MTRQWELKEETIQETSWKRSPEQIFRTALGTTFSVVVVRERVYVRQDGTVRHEPLPSVIRNMNQVGSDPRVQQLAALMTELAEEWGAEDDAAQAQEA